MSKKEKIVVIGGGLAGSLFSVCLAKRGFEVEVYERRPDMRLDDKDGGRSINLALSTRGLNALEKVGLDQEVLKQAIPMNGRMMHSAEGELTYQAYGKDGQYINSVSRAGLNRRLLELADENDNVQLHFNHRCTGCDLKGNQAFFTDENGNAKTVEADYFIATDGAFSAIRLAMQMTNRFDYSQDYQDYGYKELEITPNADGGFAMDENALHIWPRGNFMMIALPNPNGSYTCTLFMPYEGKNSFEEVQGDAKVMEFFETYFKDSIPLMPNLLEDYKQNPVGDLVTVRCDPWVRGKFALMGDSAHAVVPFYGQGMNCAFEDAAVMDDLIGEHYPNWDMIMKRYQEERIENANAIADLAIQNFKEMRDLVGQEDFLEKKRIEKALAELYPEHFKSQYELVTFTNKDYSHALAMGAVNDGIIKEIIQKGFAHNLEDSAAILPILNSAK